MKNVSAGNIANENTIYEHKMRNNAIIHIAIITGPQNVYVYRLIRDWVTRLGNA